LSIRTQQSLSFYDKIKIQIKAFFAH